MSSETLTAPFPVEPDPAPAPSLVPDRAALADAAAALVLACPGVAALHGGPHGIAATHLPGRVVVGVRVLGRTVHAHVVMRWNAVADAVAAQVRGALATLPGVDEVDVTIEDVELPAARLPSPPVAAGGRTA